MTIAELFLFFIVLAGLYFLLRPLRDRLEILLLRWLSRRRGDKIIDVEAMKADKPSKKE